MSTPAPRSQWLALRRTIAVVVMLVALSEGYGQEPIRPEAVPSPAATAVPLPSPAEEFARAAMLYQRGSDIKPTPETLGKAANLIADVLEPELVFELRPSRSKLLRTKKPVTRTSISDPSLAEVTQLGPTEFELHGLKHGETALTFWFGEPGEQQEILRYLLVVAPDEGYWEDLTKGYSELERMINEMFPNSRIQLVPIADRLILRGQARDSEDAARILQIVRGRTGGNQGGGGGGGQVVDPLFGAGGDTSAQRRSTGGVINMMRVPHEHQVMLKVRVAELSRTALREMGINFTVTGDNYLLTSVLSTGGNLTGIFNGADLSLFLKALSSNGSSKILAEPNLVTLNGQTARFIAGGQFAVPTAVGVNGIGAATTSFQGFGSQLAFTPTIIDKDMIRLQVIPTFSTLNNANSVNGIPGLNVRSVSTTVDLRTGQWLAIAGLLQDEQQGTSVRVPGLGDIPIVSVLFSNKTIKRSETELVVLVSPELVHPLEEDQLPLWLPGMDVTEPGPLAFFVGGMIEGYPDVHHRSTVYPNVRHQALREARRNAKCNTRYQRCENYYVSGAHGFSE